MPLRALLNGKSFYAWDLTESHRKEIFKCPECETEFIIVLPTLDIVKHFRHKSGASHITKPESELHLEMKQNFKNYLDENGYDSEIEVRVTSEKEYRIADILIKTLEKNIVIECQCSNISVNEFRERTKFYKQKEYQIIWILGNHRLSNLENEIRALYYDVFYYRKGSLINLTNEDNDFIDLKNIIHKTSKEVVLNKKYNEWLNLEKARVEEHERLIELRFKYEKIFDMQKIFPNNYPSEKDQAKIDLYHKNLGPNGKYTRPIIYPALIEPLNIIALRKKDTYV